MKLGGTIMGILSLFYFPTKKIFLHSHIEVAWGMRIGRSFSCLVLWLLSKWFTILCCHISHHSQPQLPYMIPCVQQQNLKCSSFFQILEVLWLSWWRQQTFPNSSWAHTSHGTLKLDITDSSQLWQPPSVLGFLTISCRLRVLFPVHHTLQLCTYSVEEAFVSSHSPFSFYSGGSRPNMFQSMSLPSQTPCHILTLIPCRY